MDSVADLGLRVDSTDILSASTNLDRFGLAAVKATQAALAVAAAAIQQAAAARNAAQATISDTQATIASAQAKATLSRAQADVAVNAGLAAIARSKASQNDDYANRLAKALTGQLEALKSAQDAVTASVDKYALAQQGASQAAASAAAMAQSQINKAANVIEPAQQASTTSSRSQDVAAYAASLDNLRREFNPLYAASKQYEDQLGRINAAEQVGAIDANEAAAARERERIAFEAEAMGASEAAGRLSGQARNVLTNLSYQINDVVSGLLMGQSPWQILTQQGGQFVQVMQMGGTGPMGLLKLVGTVLSSLLTPAILIGGALVAGGAAFAYFAYEGVAANKDLSKALEGTGQAAGVTASQLNDMAVEAAQSGNISLSSARGFAEAYAASGKVTGDSIEKLTALTQNYASTTGEDASSAVKELVSDFSDLSSGADALNKKTGFLDVATRQHIQDLEAQGDRAGAVKATIDALQPSLTNYTKNLTALGREWAGIKQLGSDANTAIGNTFDPNTQTQLANEQAHLAFLQSNKDSGGAVPQAWIDQTQAKIIQLTAQLQKEMADAGLKAKLAFIKQISLQADDVANALDPGIANIRKMMNSVTLLQNNPVETPESTRALLEQKGAMDSLADSQGELIVGGQRFLSQQQLEMKGLNTAKDAIYAKSAAQKAAIAFQESMNASAGQGIQPEERLALAQAAARNAYDTTTKSLNDQNLTLTYNEQAIIATTNAFLTGNIPATIAATAHAQALTEALTTGIDVQKRTMQLMLEAVAQKESSAAQDVHTTSQQAQAQTEANAAVTAGTLAYDRMSSFVQNRQRDLALEDIRTMALATHNTDLVNSIDAIIAAYKKLDPIVEANDKTNQVLGLINPNAQDITNLKTGAGMGLNSTQQGVLQSKTGLNSSVQSLRSDLMTANPFGAAGEQGVQGQVVAAQQEQANRLQTVQDGLQAGLIKSEQDAANMRVAINQDATQKIQAAYQALSQAQLQMGADAFGAMADSVGDLVGKSSAAYKILFGISKAFSIAQATLNLETAISNALALPFPANIPAMAAAAAAGATIISDIAAISGLAGGGVGLQGPGTSTSDSIFARLSRGESVITAAGTSGNENTLRAMNRGMDFDGMWGGAATSMPNIAIHNYNGSRIRQQIGLNDVQFMIDDAFVRNSPKIAAATLKKVPNTVAKTRQNPRNRSR